MPFVGIGVGIGRQRFAQGGIFAAYAARVAADGGVTEAGACVNAVSGISLNSSLLLVPSGYKSGVVYSQIPTNGDGDLTFTRASDATRVNSDGEIEVVGSNVPRLDYSQGSCPALLLEPQRTNLVRYSEEIDNAAFWALTNSGTISTNTTISPDGYQNADTLNAGANNAQVQGAIVGTSGAVYTVSIWVKRITGTGNVFFRAVENANTLISVTSDWQRFTATVTSTTTTIRIGINLATSGDAVAIWGAQLEVGAYATSYIKTTNSTVTRLADSFTRNNIYTNGLITSSGGTWYVELKNNVAYRGDAVGDGIFLRTTGDTDNFRFYSDNSSTNRIYIFKRVSNVNSQLYVTATDTVKIAIKWNGTTADIFVNGTKVVSATSFTATQLQVITTSITAVPKFIQQMALYPTPLSDSDCISLTTL